jgi:selenocysteine-specific elongation factor
VIIGTAGHIDHGKTSLVRSLTGVDTDRLKEEKARGISIELGYAYQATGEGRVLGFVDVPGHERFVHTMLAGATGIDFALLVIAADDGVMPQTREHAQILELLGVSRGAVALTKIDRVDAETLDLVKGEITELLEGTRLQAAPVFAVSNASGEGVEALRAFLHAQSAAHARRPRAGHFRLAVDRSFTLTGSGTVVTGTVFSGEAKLEDELMVSPSGAAVRVRSIHAQGRPAARARAGERCALNLAGIAKESVARGDWILAPPAHAPAARIDARIRLLASEKRPLRQWSSVHLHLGAAHVTARVALLEGESLAPGESALVQLVLDKPVGGVRGDLFVLRDASATRTLAGGAVIDPFGPARHRRSEKRKSILAAMEAPDTVQGLARMLALLPAGVDLRTFSRACNIPAAELVLPPGAVMVRASDAWLGFAKQDWQQWKDRTVAALGAFHRKSSEQLGPEVEHFRRLVAPELPAAAWAALADELVKEGRAARTGPLLHLPEQKVSLSADEQVLAQKVLPMLEDAGFDPPLVRDIASRLRAPEPQLRTLLLRLMKQGRVFQVVQDLFYPASTVVKLSVIAADLEKEQGSVLAAQFRDRTGLGRKRAINILEFFDRVGYTRRVNDEHKLRGGNPFAAGTAGEAKPAA